MATFSRYFPAFIALAAPLAFSGVSRAEPPATNQGYVCRSNGAIRWTAREGTVTERGDYCFKKGAGFLISKACFDEIEKCRAKYVAKPLLPESEMDSSLGSPGFRDCERTGGVPELIEFEWEGGAWKEGTRCLIEAKSRWLASTGQVTDWIVGEEGSKR